jgi:hypothetical protein
MPKYEIKNEQTDWNKKDSYNMADPYCITFIYPYSGEAPYIIKGGALFCKRWLKEHVHKAMYRQVYWRHGFSRGFMRFTSFFEEKGLAIHRKLFLDGRTRYVFMYKDNVIHATRRLPHSFPKEVKEYVKSHSVLGT